LPTPKKTDYRAIIFLLSISIFSLQFIFRSLDDNRLTSWAWVFRDIDGVRIYLVLLLGIAIAYMVSRVEPPIPHFLNKVIFLLLFPFLLVLPFWGESEVIVDASRYFTQAKHLRLYGIEYFLKEWGKGISAWTDLPVIPFLYGLIFKFLGEDRIYIQIFTTLLFSMTTLLIYQTGKRLWDEDIGFSAGLLLLGIPYIFTQVPLMLVDIPTMFFLTLSIYLFIKALEQGGIWLVLPSSFSIFLTFFSKYSTWLMLSVLFVISLVYLITKNPPLSLDKRRVVQRGIIVASITSLLIGIVFLYRSDLFLEQIGLLMNYQRPALKRWGESFISTFFFQIHPFITISALYSIYVAIKKRDLRYIIVSYLIFIVFILQIKRIRYTIIVFPMLTLMASYGLQAIKDKGLRRFIVSSAVISSIVLTTFAYLPFVKKISAVNLKDGGGFLNSLDVDRVEVLTITSRDPLVNPAVLVPILDLYTKKRIYYDYREEFSPSPDEIEESALRFTWAYKNPDYYTFNNKVSKGKKAVALISSEETLPGHLEQKIREYHNLRVFKTYDGIFHHRTIVSIFW